MNGFLRELAGAAKPAAPRPAPSRPTPGPDLAQNSRAMAREFGARLARQDDEEGALLERLPDTPPVDPVSLEMYLDGLVTKLNRSAAFVKNDPRSRGMKTASVLMRVNPDGSLQSFKVLNAGDQQDEIAFIQSVVERAVPFPGFPADMRKSARSLAMLICIHPTTAGGGSFGFARSGSGGRC